MTRSSIPKLLHKQVSIRRSGKVVRNVQTHSLISNIKQGRFERDDEISADEKNWVRLDQHYQLASYFRTKPSPAINSLPSNVDQCLKELSKMLKDLS